VAIRTGRQWQAVLGGVGIAVIGWHLLVGYSFSALLPKTMSADERRETVLNQMFVMWPMPVIMSGVFALLTACAFLCVRGVRADDTAAGRIGGLLGAAAVALAVMVLPLVPFLLPRS
jgi:heme/copper-type cytochrome/quinol oxidase subunit 2